MNVKVQAVFISPEQYRIMLWIGPLSAQSGPIQADEYTTGMAEFPTWDAALEHIRRTFAP